MKLMVPDIAFGNHTSCPRCWLWRSKLRCRSTLVQCFTTHWLPYPSQAFDLIHRSRCRTNSTRDGATFRASHAHVRDSRSAWKIF
ncbi:probable methyltransferase PMT12 [Musa acuminata AAA Group]|uniref:probable methyltransferase PMT12 n=1 Tax=Musa acuminata AAA Group TaxID=214697 RepID=UPI0031DDE829